jgi:hypothetical protein
LSKKSKLTILLIPYLANYINRKVASAITLKE